MGRRGDHTCNYCNGSTRVHACQAKTCDCRERRPCASSVGNNKRRASCSLVDPVVKRVLGSLVYGEGYGADEGDAREGRPDTAVEAMKAFGLVRMTDAVGEGIELVAVRC